ncbi:MAG: hypothetical protein M9894_08105 [Planctomycetes bacterium]|nr:hypothetical protein [Planctomycetota bacterium]
MPEPPVEPAAEVSLGQLAVARGVISVAQRDRMGIELLRRATAKRPTSMTRLLLQGGLTAPAVQALLASGATCRAVRCDACELAIPQSTLSGREERPCPRCGCLVMSFAAYAGAAPAPAPTPAAPGDALDETERWRAVLPLPGADARVSATTDRWQGVLPLPDAPAPSPTTPAAPGPADGPADGERTMAFGDVFLLPGGAARTEAEVADEMHTLVAPQGFAALAAAESASGDALPDGFDPGAVTAPMDREEIAATLRKGPPPGAARAPATPPPAEPTPPAELTIAPGYALTGGEALVPVAPPEPAPRPTARRRRAPPAPHGRPRWPWVVAALLALGALAALGAWTLARA